MVMPPITRAMNSHASDGASAVSAVAVAVHRISVVGESVVAVHVVDHAVAVIVDTVAGDFAFVDPHIVFEVGVIVVDAGVDDDGALLLQTPDGLVRVLSGEVSLRLA